MELPQYNCMMPTQNCSCCRTIVDLQLQIGVALVQLYFLKIKTGDAYIRPRDGIVKNDNDYP